MAKVFIPFGELMPDRKRFRHDGLVTAKNVVPFASNYIVAQNWQGYGTIFSEPYGIHTHFAGGSDSYLFTGTNTKLYQTARSGLNTLTDKTRLVGGSYSASSNDGWFGCSFGDNVVMTDYADDPQLLTSPSAANFEKLAQSGGANPGMDPKAQFAFPIRQNLFLGKLNLSASFDGLSSGANPTCVAWSQSDNVRQYGSFNATPQLIGAGYQPLNYDAFGHITGGIGGEYGLVAMQGGWVRIDGPPYSFRPIAPSKSTRFPNSIARYGDDVYYWGSSGPAALRGGETPVDLGLDKVSRTLIDNLTGFSPTYSIHPSAAARQVACAADPVNGLVAWNYRTNAGTYGGDVTLYYNPSDGRFSFAHNYLLVIPPVQMEVAFLKAFPDQGGTWSVGRDFVGARYTSTNGWGICIPSYDLAGASAPALETSYRSFEGEGTTRIASVRPIFSRSDLVETMVVTVAVSTLNKPYDTPVTKTASAQNSQGAISVTDSVWGSFHSVNVTWTTDSVGDGLQKIMEIEGIEVDVIDGGPAYGG